MSYKYSTNPSKYHYIFFLYKNIYLRIREFLYLSKIIFYKYQLLTTLSYHASDTN
jgi:hypothetical protein